jgi:hypothetical protein
VLGILEFILDFLEYFFNTMTYQQSFFCEVFAEQAIYGCPDEK